MAAVCTAKLVVRAHQAPYVSFLYSSLKGGQVNFAQGSFAALDIDGPTLHFLVVQCTVLHAASYTVRLYALYVRHTHRCAEQRVFAHILEVTPVERCAVDVDTRAQHHVLVSVGRFFSEGTSVFLGHLRIPGCCETGERGEGRAGVCCPSCILPFVPVDFRTYTVRTVTHPQPWDAESRHTAAVEFPPAMANAYLFGKRHS